MDISVIISTYKRKKQILETIKSFSNQTYQKFEMVIVDQGPEFLSAEEISNLNLTFSLKYLRLDKPNLTKARNAGIRSADRDILLFCDDDIVPDKFLIERHLDNYNDSSIGGVGGRIISSGRREKRISFKSLYPWIGSFNPVDASLISNFHLDKRCEVKHINGCNMSFRKDLLIRAGMFDESLRGTANFEDTDMSFRVKRLGYKLLFEPKAQVKHLKLTYGGCQMKDFNGFIYWLYYTETLIYLRYFKRVFLPFFLTRIFIRIFIYAFLKMDMKIVGRAKKGFLDAMKKYSEEKKAVIEALRDKGIKKILVMKFGGIGDILFLVPSLKALKKRFPRCSISLMTQPPGASVVMGSPWVDNYVFSDFYGYVFWNILTFKFYKEIWNLFKILRKKDFDIFLEFHDLSWNLSSIFKPALVSYMSKAPRRIGFEYKGRGFFLTDKVPEIKLPKTHNSKHFADIVKVVGAEVKDTETEIWLEKEDIKFAKDIFERHQLKDGAGTVAIHPGANFQTRRWDIHKFASLADVIAKEFKKKIIIIGSPNEIELSEEIIALMDSEPIDLVGRTTVKQLAAIIKKCELFIGNDSGPLHIAVAMKTPAIGIFGPADYERAVYMDNHRFKFVRKEVHCSPCYKRICREHLCIKLISVGDILEKVKDFLKDEQRVFVAR